MVVVVCVRVCVQILGYGLDVLHASVKGRRKEDNKEVRKEGRTVLSFVVREGGRGQGGYLRSRNTLGCLRKRKRLWLQNPASSSS